MRQEGPAPPPSKRDQIVATALALFSQYGVHAVGVDRVIAEADVAKATLYKHFRSKDDLVVAVLERKHTLAAQALLDVVEAASQDPLERFVALAPAMAGGAEHGCLFVLAAQEFPATDHPVQATSRRHKRAMRDLYRDLAAAAGVRDPGAAGDRAQLILDGLCAACALGPDDAERATRAAEASLRALVAEG